jgi:MFS family permease
MPIVLGIMSTRIPGLVAKFGFRRFLIMGPILVAVGLILLSRLPVDGTYASNLLPALLIIPLGIGMTFMPLIAAATSGVPRHEAGLASGLITTSQQMGGALGLAIISGAAASVTAASAYLGATGALVHGFDRAMLVGLVFMAVAVALAVAVIRPQRPNPTLPQTQENENTERPRRVFLIRDIR